MALRKPLAFVLAVLGAAAISGCAGAGTGGSALPAVAQASASNGSRSAQDLGGGPIGFYNLSHTVGGVLETVVDGTVTGAVATSSGAAVAGVTVSAGFAGSATTAADGSFSLSLPPGTYTLTIAGSSTAKTVTVLAGVSVSVGTLTF